MGEGQGSFAEIAVALSLASSKLQLDLTKTRIIADRIGLSKMGCELIIPSLERDIALVGQALQIFKDMSDVEDQVRAVISRKKRGSWFPSLARAAVI